MKNKRKPTMITIVKIIYLWLLAMFLVCGIGLWIYKSINYILGFIIVICVGVSIPFWAIYAIKNWRCPHCGHDMPGLRYCKYCGERLDDEAETEK